MQIYISIDKQQLELKNKNEIIKSYSISSGKNGVGQEPDSEKTPLGKHEISEKIGEQAPINTVFVGRKPTGEIFTPELYKNNPGRDWILTRILWLSGLENGKNRGDGCDTKARYIYIHGTPANTVLGVPGSRGCIRMRNEDIIELFKLVSVGDAVYLDL